ncbi:MAG: flagellar hook capping protein [Epulopiscium sp.]|nr:flagellar hook capping protein [Candidatus Epulonipiscium sp.]
MSSTVNKTYTPIENIRSHSKQPSGTPVNDLDKNAFLNLLVTQMRYQDPLNPTTDREFLAQMAQFTALEQMQNLNQNFAFAQGTALIGKGVQATIGNPLTSEMELVEGVVEGVRQKNGKTFLVVGNKEVPVDKVKQVIDHIDWSYQDPFSFIGKIVQVQLPIKEGEEKQVFEGVVEHIQMKEGEPYLVVSDQLFSLEDVHGVVENTSLVGKWIEVDVKHKETGEAIRKQLKIDAVRLIQDQVILISGEHEFNMKEIHKILNQSKTQ